MFEPRRLYPRHKRVATLNWNCWSIRTISVRGRKGTFGHLSRISIEDLGARASRPLRGERTCGRDARAPGGEVRRETDDPASAQRDSGSLWLLTGGRAARSRGPAQRTVAPRSCTRQLLSALPPDAAGRP